MHPSSDQQIIPATTVSTVGDNATSVLERAVVQAVTYSDIFDYPLTTAEIQRYLIGIRVTPGEIDRVLQDGALVPRYLSHVEGYFSLAGRASIVETRRKREQEALRRWPQGLRYGRVIASLPFVRMVAITGELAMDNMGPHSDIDYFIVTEPGRLWLCRLMVVAVVRYAAPRGDTICPNFLLAETALTLDDRNLYTAHEVAQMVPITGHDVYRKLRELNGWVDDYLPNACATPRAAEVQPRGRPIRTVVEKVLRTRAGARLERWEMDRKVRKLTRTSITNPEVSFSPEWCKGHVDGHGGRILATFAERWQAVEGLMQ